MGQYPSSISTGAGPPSSLVDEREAQASNGLRRRRSTNGTRPDIKRQCSLEEDGSENHSEEEGQEDANAESSGVEINADADSRSSGNNNDNSSDNSAGVVSVSENDYPSPALERRDSGSVSPLSATSDPPSVAMPWALENDTHRESPEQDDSPTSASGPHSLNPSNPASPSAPLLGATNALLNQNQESAPRFSLRDWPLPPPNMRAEQLSSNIPPETQEPQERNTLDPELEFFDAPSSFHELTSLLRGTATVAAAAAAAAAAATTTPAPGDAASESNVLPRPTVPRVAPLPLHTPPPPPFERPPPPPPPRRSYFPELPFSRGRARTPEEEEVMALLGMLRSAAIVTADHLVGSELVNGELYRGTTATPAAQQMEQQQQQQQQQQNASTPHSEEGAQTESASSNARSSASNDEASPIAAEDSSASAEATPPRVITFADFLEQLRNGTHTAELMQLMFDTANATNFFRFFRFPHDRDGRVPILLLGIRSAEITGGRAGRGANTLQEENELFAEPIPDRIPETSPTGRRPRRRHSATSPRSPATAPRRSNPISELFEDELFDGARLNTDPEDRVDDLLARLYRGVNSLDDDDDEDDDDDDDDDDEYEDDYEEDEDDEESDEESIYSGNRSHDDSRFDRGVWMDALRDAMRGEPNSRARRTLDRGLTSRIQDDEDANPSDHSQQHQHRNETPNSGPWVRGDAPQGTHDESGAEDARPEVNTHGRRRRSRRTWVIYVIGGSYPPNHPIFSARSLQTDHPTYEDMLLVEQLLGYGKPSVATKDDIASAGGTSTLGPDSPLLSERCPICLTDYMEGDVCRTLSCKHTFHQECVDSWLMKSHNSCPMCRHEGVPGKNSVPSSAGAS